MRVKPRTKKAIKIMAGELQVKRAKSVSEDEALWEFIKANAPQIVKKVEESPDDETD